MTLENKKVFLQSEMECKTLKAQYLKTAQDADRTMNCALYE